jgi:ubiquinone biosynthesis protein COQ9
VRDRLFDLIMRRLDALQAHRAGVLAVMRALPREPSTTLLLAWATRRSMRWFLHAAGVGTAGVRGELKLRGLVGVWLWTLRTWERDDSSDLSTTMASLDSALSRAERAVRWLHGGPRGEAPEKKPPERAEPPADTEAPPENP